MRQRNAMSAHPALFSPIAVGGRRLKNRLVCLPVYTGYAHPGGWVGTLMIEHYSRLSQTGVAMVVVANAAVSADGVVSDFNLRIDTDEYIPGLARLAAAIRSRGALACLQLNHAGRFARTDRPLLPAPLTPANLAFNVTSLKDFMNFFPLERRFGLTHRFLKLAGAWTREMGAEAKQKVIADFGAAAVRACEAGFDMIELHGAGGYLLCQFLSSFTHAGPLDGRLSLPDRTAFPLAVLREVKRRIPDRFPVGFRLITREWVPDGVDLPEAISFARMLESEGVAYVSASAGTYNSMFSPKIRKQTATPGYLAADVAELTGCLHIPTVASGRIISPKQADRMVRDNVARLVGLGRALRVDPNWAARAKTVGQGGRACINCSSCLKRVVLDRGFNCRRWPAHVREKTDLEIRLLNRNWNALFVAVTPQDLALLHRALANLLPDGKSGRPAVSSTFLILKTPAGTVPTDHRIAAFFGKADRILHLRGLAETRIRKIVRQTEPPFDREVNRQVAAEGHGLIVIPCDRRESWRGKVALSQRNKIIAYIGRHPRWANVLVPVDMSINTLLTLVFLNQAFMGRPGFRFTFVHVPSGPPRTIERRWLKIKKIAGLDPDIPLRLIPSAGHVADDLLTLARAEGFGTIVMGRRGVSRMKRWLLGSVSARLWRGIADQTVVLVD